MKSKSHCKEEADISFDLELTHLEQGLLRLGRVHVDANAASRGRDAVASLAARGFMRTWLSSEHASLLCGEITEAGRMALAWVNGQDGTPTAH